MSTFYSGLQVEERAGSRGKKFSGGCIHSNHWSLPHPFLSISKAEKEKVNNEEKLEAEKTASLDSSRLPSEQGRTVPFLAITNGSTLPPILLPSPHPVLSYFSYLSHSLGYSGRSWES